MITTINMQSQNHIYHRRNKYNHVQPASNQYRRCLGHDLGPKEPQEPFQRKHVVIVMDAMREFSVETLEWVLKNIALDTCCTITLLGVKPWLTFALSCKTETDIWTMNIEDLLSMRDTSEWRNDPRYQKAQQLIELCIKYKVKPHIESGQGFPKRLLVLEKAACATWVIFDRHHNKKHIEYVSKKVPCIILVMNNNREADMLPRKSVFSTTFESNDESPTICTSSTIPTPKLMLSDEYKRKLNLSSQ